MGIIGRLFGVRQGDRRDHPQVGTAPRSATPPTLDRALVAPDWNPSAEWERRLATFARKVARELNDAGVDTSRPGANYWIASYDVQEAVWWPAERGSWEYMNGRTRAGWSNGAALVLFVDGRLAHAEFFGEVDPLRESVKISNVTPPRSFWDTWRAASGNVGRWRDGTGGVNPQAVQHFRGRWLGGESDDQRPPGVGVSAELKRLMTTHRSQTPRYY